MKGSTPHAIEIEPRSVRSQMNPGALAPERRALAAGMQSPAAGINSPAEHSSNTSSQVGGRYCLPCACRVAVPTCGSFGTDLMTRRYAQRTESTSRHRFAISRGVSE